MTELWKMNGKSITRWALETHDETCYSKANGHYHLDSEATDNGGNRYWIVETTAEGAEVGRMNLDFIVFFDWESPCNKK